MQTGLESFRSDGVKHNRCPAAGRMRAHRGLHILAGAINHVRCARGTYSFHTLAARYTDDMRSAIG